ncbi:hypothetical protein RBH29_16825 [Herbivorax sp. ANBcel31]|uniref:hypothetical protein n=1 Tax=Herbivorax sp. ANBcel31 TaxID=3069754 RepID=UPI0027B5ABC7|nr:hypothetical protein [Herbivorax sp. ANBcel31]MDQ2088093.1 hypothetical protein [Herbivorax sp. ANBcel31]
MNKEYNKMEETINKAFFIFANFLMGMLIWGITISFVLIEAGKVIDRLIGLIFMGIICMIIYKVIGRNKEYYKKYYKFLRVCSYILGIFMFLTVVVEFTKHNEVRNLILGIPATFISTFLVLCFLKRVKQSENTYKKDNEVDVIGTFLFMGFNFLEGIFIYGITISFAYIEPIEIISILMFLVVAGLVSMCFYKNLDKFIGDKKIYYKKYYKFLKICSYILGILMLLTVIMAFLEHREIVNLILGVFAVFMATFLLYRFLHARGQA